MRKYAPPLALAMAALLAACAGAPQKRAPFEVDGDYVASVERAAQQVGVEVVWVNPPRKPRVVADNDG